MLTNLIGIVLAFITVMLLLSLVVMGLVQLAQSLFRLRGRNLLVGIAALIASEGLSDSHETAARSRRRRLSPKKHTDHAADVLNATTAAKLRPETDPNSLMNVVRGPATSWVDPEDLARTMLAHYRKKAANSHHKIPVATKATLSGLPGGPVTAVVDATEIAAPADTMSERDLAAKFQALEPAMSDRFARTMQMWTAICGLVVAVVFQVSTPALLQVLSTSQAKRDAVLALMPSVMKQADSTVVTGMSDDFVDRALAQLAADPVVTSRTDADALKSKFEQVSGSTDSRQAMIDDLRAVLTGVDNRDAIVRRYGEIIDTTASHDVTNAIATTTASVDSLGMIDIRPWGQGGDFYWRPVNIIGVLMTAILLSFGAPFWFEQLKNVASLRDALSTPTSTEKKS